MQWVGVAAAAAGVLWLRNRAAAAKRHPKSSSGGGGGGGGSSKQLLRGAAIRRFFHLTNEFVLLNHGSYGTVPKPVLEVQHRAMTDVERFPDDYYRRHALDRYRQSCAAAAALVNGPPSNVVLVRNATSGVNCALRSAAYPSGAAILVTNSSYNACKNVVLHLAETQGVEVVVAQLPTPKPGVTYNKADLDAAVLAAFEEQLEAHPNIAVALVDHIISMPSYIVPVKAVVQLCHKFNVKVCIDGAHAPGQIPVDVQDIGAEWYTGNMHKWAFGAKTSAILHVAPSEAAMLQSLVISHFWKLDLQSRFYMQGTGDHSAYLAVPASLKFAEDHGGFPSISQYNHDLLCWAAVHCSDVWGTEPATALDCVQSMVMVRTPLKWEWYMPAGATFEDAKADVWLGKRLEHSLFSKFGVQSVFMLCGDADSHAVYVRLSAMVYNTQDDFKRLAESVVELCAALAS